MSCCAFLGLIMFIVCLSAWDCSFVSFAKFGTFSAIASSNMLLVPLALSLFKHFLASNTQMLYLLLLSHWTQSLLMFGFYRVFSLYFRWSELYFSVLGSIIFTLCYLHSNKNPMRFLFLFYVFSCLYFPFVSFLFLCWAFFLFFFFIWLKKTCIWMLKQF